jgi:hypothetical protein
MIFLGFLRSINSIFPISIEIDIFSYKISYQKVLLKEVSRFYHLSSFFYIFLSILKDTKNKNYLSKNPLKILTFFSKPCEGLRSFLEFF